MDKHGFIITADDYGMCDIVNTAIDECIKAGIVKSTNVIVNMDALKQGADLKKQYKGVSVGLHWNVTAGKPVSDLQKVPTLINSDGKFYNVAEFKRRYHKKLICETELIYELTKQYEIFKRITGSEPDYWNTHQNSALDFSTFDVFNGLALKLGILKTRSFRRVYVKDKKIHGIRKHMLEVMKNLVFRIWFGYIIPRTGTKLPDGRMVYFDDRQKLEIRNITDQICWKRKRVVELVIHPATSSIHPYFGNISDMRVEEYRMFSSPKTKKRINEQKIDIVNFDAIK